MGYWTFNDRCSKHPRYRGTRRKADGCAHCYAIYATRHLSEMHPEAYNDFIQPFKVYHDG